MIFDLKSSNKPPGAYLENKFLGGTLFVGRGYLKGACFKVWLYTCTLFNSE